MNTNTFPLLSKNLNRLAKAMVRYAEARQAMHAIEKAVEDAQAACGDQTRGIGYSGNDASIQFSITAREYLATFPNEKPTIKSWVSETTGDRWASTDYPPRCLGVFSGKYVWVTCCPACAIVEPAKVEPTVESKAA